MYMLLRTQMAGNVDLRGRRIGEFVLRELLDEGGFGSVYRCEQPTLGREAVIKVLQHRFLSHDVQLQRFLREAQLASRLDHPYAAHIYAFGSEERDQILWIAMEFVHGTTLKQWLAERGPMPLAQFVAFFEHVGEVVDTAHRCGIVHRDIKPSNVMVIERAGRVLPKLLDFGVAKLLDGERLPESTPETVAWLRKVVTEKVPEEVLQQYRVGPATITCDAVSQTGGRLTPDGAPIGTPAYMAPEQWSNAVTVGPRADLYALAVVGYEALTGRHPFEGATKGEYIPFRLRDQAPLLGGGLPPALDRVFQRALAQQPEDRWASAIELAGAIRLASGLGVTRADLPRIDPDVRDAWMARAPQPFAEALAELHSAHNVHQARDIAEELLRTLLRYLLALAFAMAARAHDDLGDPALLELVRALARRSLGVNERIALLRLLVRRPADSHGGHLEPAEPAVPELLAFMALTPAGTDALDPILALQPAADRAVTEDMVRWQLLRLLPVLTQLLRRATFVLDYALVVPRDDVAERWTRRRSKPRVRSEVSSGELIEGHPMLVDPSGRVCVDLWPLVQAASPADGADPELFLLDGHGPHGALLIAAPFGLEHHDVTARDWLAAHLIDEIERKTRMRDHLQVSAQQWQDRGRPKALLWRGEVLAELERWMRRTAGALSFGDPEGAFVAASRRAGRRTRWLQGSLVAAGVATVLVVLAYRFVMNERMAEQAEVEQGRQALLHDDLDEAQLHLAEGYQRGDHSYAVKFMYTHARQPLEAEQARFAAAAGRMWSAAFSPDSQRIVASDDRGARVWDARTRQLLLTLPHGDTVYDARYSADGAQLITASGDGAVRIWDAVSGTRLRELRNDGKPSRYFATAISPDGKLVAAIDTKGAVAHVWDAGSGTQVAALLNDAFEFPTIAFSADGRWLATSGGDDVRVFDTATWTQVLALAGPRIINFSFDPTGPYLVTGSARGDAAIWEIPSGRRVWHLREGGEPVDAVAFSPNGQLVATASRDGASQIWDARSGALQNQFTPLHSKILSIEFDATSKLVVAAGASGAVVVADVAQGMPVVLLEGPRGAVMTAHFAPDSRRVIGASWDGTARIWDATSPYRRWSSPPISDDCGLGASLEPDQRFLAIGCRDHPTRVWDTAHDQLLAELPSVTPVDGDFSSAFPAVSSAGDRAAIARGETVEIYELPGGRLLRTIRHPAAVNAVAFAPAGHDVISGAIDGSVFITRDSRSPVALPAASGGVDAVALLPDGRAVVADARGRLRICDPSGGTTLADLVLSPRVRMLRASPDGMRLIAIPRYTGPAGLWDLGQYRPIASLDGHAERVYSARFVADGQEIITAGADGTARLWDGKTGQLRQIFRGGARFLADATITPDGLLVVAGGGDGLLRFWDAASEHLLWTLPAHKSYVIGIHFEGDSIVTRGFAGDVSRWTIAPPADVIEVAPSK